MRRYVAKSTSYLLAAAYLTLAVMGHAWHDHGSCSTGPCSDGACADAACGTEAATACDCDLHLLLAERAGSQPTPLASEGFSSQKALGHPHDCLACEALKHLKVGYCVLPTFGFAETAAQTASQPADAAILEAWPLVHGPRGPPQRG